MSREDANLIIAAAGLIVAMAAMWAGVYAIRRDRADLRVTAQDAAAGDRYLIVVNVGMRPVRIERLLVRWWGITPRLSKTMSLQASVFNPGRPDEPLPTVVEAAAAVRLHYAPAEYWEVVGQHRHDILVEDAAGRRYPIRAAPDVDYGPAAV